MVTGGKVLLVLGVVSTTVLIGCGQSHRQFNAKTDGVLIQAEGQTQEEVQNLYPANKVTVVSTEDNILKIQGVTLEDVQEKLPHVYAEEDYFYNYVDPTLETKEALAKRNKVQKKIYELNCRNAKPTPVADIRIMNQPNWVGRNTVYIDSGDIILSAEGSKSGRVAPAKEPDSPWEMVKKILNPFAKEEKEVVSAPDVDIHWIVEAPEDSATQKESTDSEIRVTPDQTGGYVAVLIVQDPLNKACDIIAGIVGVTVNEKLKKTPQKKGVYDSEAFFHVPLIDADLAWNITDGSGVTIAVIDTGVNYNHADLQQNIKINKNEIPNNGIDDDGNGYIDDVYGWDFALNDAIPFDDNMHGTHVAGLAASSVSGIAKGAKILPIKALLPTGSGTTSAIISAINYAVDQNVDIINMSLGGPGDASPLLIAAVQRAQKKGILIVAAAGNTSENLDVVPSHLTAKDGSNVLSVAATDENYLLTDYSNYSSKYIDIAAPGGTHRKGLLAAYSRTKTKKYIAIPGTSMACPVTAGVAALVKARFPSLTAEEIKQVVVNSGTDTAALAGRVSSGKVVNALSAIESARHIHTTFAAN